MAVYKEEKTNTWRAVYRYTDWNGERKQTQKRGFKTKREAQAWEREQLNKASADLDMTFKSFVDLYTADMKTRLKENTWSTKEHIIRTKLLPYFGKLKMCKITAQQIITWQNEMMNHKDEQGKPYSPVYLKTVHNQLSAIFNHAVRYYNLRENPCKKAGSMGKKKNREMQFWTKEEYLKFIEAVKDKPYSYHAFQILYWCGLRVGELLALTSQDIDFDNGAMHICNTVVKGDMKYIEEERTKTKKSDRVIALVDFTVPHLKALKDEQLAAGLTLDKVCRWSNGDDIKHDYISKKFNKLLKANNLPSIRYHDLRHTAASLLIVSGATPQQTQEFLGHETVSTTMNIYAHCLNEAKIETAILCS